MGGSGPLDFDETHYLKVTPYAMVSSNGKAVLTPGTPEFIQDYSIQFESGNVYVIEYFDANSLFTVDTDYSADVDGNNESGIKITIRPLDLGNYNANLTFIAKVGYQPNGHPLTDKPKFNIGTITFNNSNIEYSSGGSDTFECKIHDPSTNSEYTDFEIMIIRNNENFLLNDVEFKHVWAE